MAKIPLHADITIIANEPTKVVRLIESKDTRDQDRFILEVIYPTTGNINRVNLNGLEMKHIKQILTQGRTLRNGQETEL